MGYQPSERHSIQMVNFNPYPAAVSNAALEAAMPILTPVLGPQTFKDFKLLMVQKSQTTTVWMYNKTP